MAGIGRTDVFEDFHGAQRPQSVGRSNRPRESVEQFRATVKSDRAKWAAVVKEVGATID